MCICIHVLIIITPTSDVLECSYLYIREIIGIKHGLIFYNLTDQNCCLIGIPITTTDFGHFIICVRA